MKLKFYFRFSFFFAVKTRNRSSIFVFHFSPSGRKRNSNHLIIIKALRFSFSVTQKKFPTGSRAVLARAAVKRFIRNWHSFPYSLVIIKPFDAS